jgi:hypothetical protein
MSEKINFKDSVKEMLLSAPHPEDLMKILTLLYGKMFEIEEDINYLLDKVADLENLQE